MVYQRPRRGMRKNDGCFGDLESRAHSIRRHMAQVDQHSKSIHFADHFASKGCEPMMLRRVGGRIRPIRVERMRQRHVSGAECIQLSQYRQGVIDLMSTLDPDQRSNSTRLMDSTDIGRGVSHLQIGRIALGHLADDVDLLDRRLHRRRLVHLHGHVHGPELAADLAASQTRDIRHQRHSITPKGQCMSIAVQVDRRKLAMEALANLPRQIVMAVNEWRLLQDMRDAGRVIRCRRSSNAENGQSQKHQTQPAGLVTQRKLLMGESL